MKTTFAIAAAALAAGANAQGSLAVINYCDFDIYLWSVAGAEAPGPMITLPGSTPEVGYQETFRLPANKGGISVKVAPNYITGGGIPRVVTQLEYTLPDGSNPEMDGLVFYDVSWVNDNAFNGIPMTMQTSTGGTPNACPSGTCGAGVACDIGYLWDTDDKKTHACSSSADIIFSFCSAPGGNLLNTMGAMAWGNKKREAEAQAEPDSDADPLAVCIGLGGGIAGLCDEPSTTSSSTTTSSTTTTSSSTTTKAVTTAAPIIALQKTTSAAPPPVTTTSAAPPPPASSAPAANKWVGTTIPFESLINLASTPVTQWYTYTGGMFSKRDLVEPMKREAHVHNHLHSHQQFHRRNRIVKNTA